MHDFLSVIDSPWLGYDSNLMTDQSGFSLLPGCGYGTSANNLADLLESPIFTYPVDQHLADGDVQPSEKSLVSLEDMVSSPVTFSILPADHDLQFPTPEVESLCDTDMARVSSPCLTASNEVQLLSNEMQALSPKPDSAESSIHDVTLAVDCQTNSEIALENGEEAELSPAASSSDSLVEVIEEVLQQPCALDHAGDPVLIFSCLWIGCSEAFATPDELAEHMQAHIQPTPIPHNGEFGTDEAYICLWAACPRVGMPFKVRYKFVQHLHIHTGKCPFMCCVCGKQFARDESRRVHELTHSNKRPYICQYAGCERAFKSATDRLKHFRTHRDARPYTCKFPGCTKRYTDPSSLRKHVRRSGHHFYPFYHL